MTFLVERLAELRRHLDHLRELQPRVPGREAIEADLSLHNDVLFSLFTVCQLVIDLEDGRFTYVDGAGNPVEATRRFRARHVIRDGRRLPAAHADSL